MPRFAGCVLGQAGAVEPAIRGPITPASTPNIRESFFSDGGGDEGGAGSGGGRRRRRGAALSHVRQDIDVIEVGRRLLFT